MAKKRTRKKSPTSFRPLIYGIRPAPCISTHITVSQGIDSARWADEILWVPVINSDNVGQIMYDKDSRALYLFFQSGRTWRYDNVPPSVAENCFNVNSIGGFEWQVLRKSHPATEVTGTI